LTDEEIKERWENVMAAREVAQLEPEEETEVPDEYPDFVDIAKLDPEKVH